MAVTSATALLFAAFLAARNLRAGRGDRRGARRLATAIILITAIGWICSVHWIASVALVDIVFYNACQWLAMGAIMWLFYIALEPAVRARWPHAIVTWNRILAGRWNDPLVGAHVLFGALTGLAITYLFVGNARFMYMRGRFAAIASASTGIDVRHLITDVCIIGREAIESGLVVIFAIFCLRVVFRKDWIAAFAAAFLLTLREGEVWRNGEVVVFAGYVAVFALLAFVLLRLGLISTIIAIFVVNILMLTPGAQDLTHWYEWTVIAYPIIILALVIWAFWRTSGVQMLDAGANAT